MILTLMGQNTLNHRHRQGKVKERLDKLLVQEKIASTREKAQAYILTGCISVNGEKLTKPSAVVSRRAEIVFRLPKDGYVSRGGIKLEGALKDFEIDVSHAFCFDIGASTGGFTDCLLQKGADFVTALDVGKNQIDFKLRRDPRVKVIEEFNARQVDTLRFDTLDIVTIDVSFISLKFILKPLKKIINQETKIVALIKPQFELKGPYKGFKGVVTEHRRHCSILHDLHSFFKKSGFTVHGYSFSQIKGPKGNIEYFVYLKKEGLNAGDEWVHKLEHLVQKSHYFFQQQERGSKG
jgi:23S rRNA (cytidine1920-2'-O)/16S rRNA (cytidine1409-2'-O)-methyltransferase